jgi:hypothetical protein
MVSGQREEDADDEFVAGVDIGMPTTETAWVK